MSEAVAFVEPEARREHVHHEPMLWHDLANLFPLLEGEAFWSLVEDIRTNGVREPIVMYEGRVLDGRNRYLAAREAGVDYPLIQYDGADPLAFVVSLNLKRRHLDATQRAAAAAKIAKLPPHRPEGGKFAGIPTQAQAAELLSVSERTVRSAAAVLDHGAPELVATMEAGAVTASAAAEVAKLPEALQAEVVEADAVAEVAREVRAIPANDPELAEKRIAVAEAAARGHRSSTAPTRRNPEYRPNPARDVALAVADACQVIASAVANTGCTQVLAGFADAAERRRAEVKMIAAQAAIGALLEAADAD